MFIEQQASDERNESTIQMHTPVLPQHLKTTDGLSYSRYIHNNRGEICVQEKRD